MQDSSPLARERAKMRDRYPWAAKQGHEKIDGGLATRLCDTSRMLEVVSGGT
jgi:hypothetical protein